MGGVSVLWESYLFQITMVKLFVEFPIVEFFLLLFLIYRIN
jgi:hypothetical protein